MLEVGKFPHPLHLQFVTGADVVIMCESALDCVREKRTAEGETIKVFSKPIPTMSGILCRDCSVCMLCRGPTTNTIRHRGRSITVCCSCADNCKRYSYAAGSMCAIFCLIVVFLRCKRPIVKHHDCCPNTLLGW